MVPATCSSKRNASRDKEEDRDPYFTGISPNNFGAKGDDATDGVDNTKHRCCLDIVGISDVHLLLGFLSHVDHLVGGGGCVGTTLLIHF